MTGSVRRHPEGGWIADVSLRGTRRTRRAATKALAEKERAALVREIEEAGGRPAEAESFTLIEARRLTLEIRWKGQAWERTAAIYSQQAVEFLGPRLPVSDVTPASIEAWRRDQLAKGARPGTINRRVSTLRAMLSDAARHGHLSALPMFPPQLRAMNGRERILEDHERDAIEQALAKIGQPMLADVVEFLVETGARVGEALRLRGQDVDLKARRVTFWKTKNGRPRTVPLTGRAVDALTRNMPALPSRRVFPVEYESLRHYWERAKELTGLGEDDALVLHSLRHTCATKLARGGISLHQLQAWGGWSSLSACQRYLHHSVDSLGACVSVLEGGQ